MRLAALRLLLRAIQIWDRWRLRTQMRRHPGLSIHPDASRNLASARFDLGQGARVIIEAGVKSERRQDGVRFQVRAGAELVVGEGVWLRSDVQPIHLAVFEDATMRIGRDAFLNGCHLSAKLRVETGACSMIGPGTRVFDSDQHPKDAESPERSAPVVIGDYVWVASDATVLRGVTIGAETIVAARSLVTRDLPAHSLAVGSPAEVRGQVGDRRSPMEEWALAVRRGLRAAQ